MKKQSPRNACEEPGPGVGAPSPSFQIPASVQQVELGVNGRKVRLTNLRKVFWPDLGFTKRDLLQYYLDVSPYLLPHIQGRAMVMKRYPHGITGDYFFMKRAPSPRPDWITICSIEHDSGNVIDFPIVRDLPSLLWIINLGCIDLNQWYARCDDVNRPDYLHFDLDPTEGAGFQKVLEAARFVHQMLDSLGFPHVAKTTGSRGIHIYVPIHRGPVQKQVWEFAKSFARSVAQLKPELITAEYQVARRPRNHVLVDYNQNAWGRTLASVYSVRPRPQAPVSAPVSWEEINRGMKIEDFRMDNIRPRLRQVGDLWAPLLDPVRRVDLESFRQHALGAATLRPPT
ncbi:MAG: non-homologous end-joining DNA ligase [Acidobacteriota bacterium]